VHRDFLGSLAQRDRDGHTCASAARTTPRGARIVRTVAVAHRKEALAARATPPLDGASRCRRETDRRSTLRARREAKRRRLSQWHAGKLVHHGSIPSERQALAGSRLYSSIALDHAARSHRHMLGRLVTVTRTVVFAKAKATASSIRASLTTCRTSRTSCADMAFAGRSPQSGHLAAVDPIRDARKRVMRPF